MDLCDEQELTVHQKESQQQLTIGHVLIKCLIASFGTP
jgi:hypothetical protein